MWNNVPKSQTKQQITVELIPNKKTKQKKQHTHQQKNTFPMMKHEGTVVSSCFGAASLHNK